MKRFNKLSIKLCIFSSILILAIIGVMAHFIMKDAKASLITEFKLRSDSFARASREAFVPQLDLFNLHLRVNEISGEKAVKYALIADKTGKIISHSEADKIGEIDNSPEGKASRNYDKALVQKFISSKNNLECYYMSVPIFLGAERLATSVIALSHETINEALADTKNKILIISLIALLFAILGTIIIVNWFTRRLPVLVKAAQEVGDGKLDLKIKGEGTDEIGLLTKAFNNMIRGLKERDYIRGMFKKYMSSKEVADAVLRGGLSLGGERKDIVVLFADIRDFSTITLKYEPEETVKLLNDYFSIMTKIIIKRGGNIDKYIGDGLMAVFGAPFPVKNAELQALSSAIEMRNALKDFNSKRESSKLDPIKIGTCVTSGLAIVGNIGSEEHTEYTAIGEPVNLAGRLEGLNKRLGTSLIVSKSISDKMKETFPFKELGAQQIRGWKDPLEIFELPESVE
ncbi:MAG: adenylate/guanylate cyclase domain-containing protein [Elusimicrobiota bacterium]|nr:adenylate/guanylate cyclase domain-containing protein [Elusimicrobiota bacterium]